MMIRALCTILLFSIMVPVVFAAGITMTAEQQDYYFVVGQNADIPVSVTNDYAKAIPGTIQFSIDEKMQNAGFVMTSSRSQAYSYVIPSGNSPLTISGGTSAVPKDMAVHISFDYTETTPVHVTMPEITIHFVSDPNQAKNTPSQVQSTSGTGAAHSQSSSSIQIVQQSVNIPQQSGNNGNPQSAVQNNQLQQDTNAIRQQLQQEKDTRARDKSDFDELLASDQLFREVNESLVLEGFTRQSLDIQPAANDTGTFSMLYRKGADQQVIVQGSMQKGIVPSVNEKSNALINTTPALVTNSTRQAFDQTLKEQGFKGTNISINKTLSGAIVNVSYTNAAGKKAFVNATVVEGNVTSIALEKETESTPFPLLPVILLAVVILVICGWSVYQKYFQPKRRQTVPPARFISPKESFDHRTGAKRLLEQAQRSFEDRNYPEAYGLCGQALRVFLSYEYGACAEMTNTEIIAFLRLQGKDTGRIQDILLKCSDVEFAHGDADAKEFSSFVENIHRIISTK